MTKQEYKEICAEVQNSGIPVPSQQKIIDACGKQVVKKPIVKKDAYGIRDAYYCLDCGCYIRSTMTRREIILEENLYCGSCGQKLDWSDEE